MKLFIIVLPSLSTGMKCAQSVHAMHAFTHEHPAITASWEPDNNIVVLEHDDLATLAADLEGRGLAVARFHEPDLDGTLTAICAEPAARRSLAKLKLAA